MEGVIYGLSDVSDPERIRYIGKTQRGLSVRLREHFADSRNRPRGAVGRWLANRDPSQVLARVLSSHSTLDDLNNAEIRTISEYKSRGLADLNLAPGGAGTAVGTSRSEPTPLRGENHPQHVLTWNQVRELRSLRQNGFVPAKELAQKYGVGTKAIRDILRGRTWTDSDYDPTLVVPYENRRDHGGERSPLSKLDRQTVSEIRSLRKVRYVPASSLADDYGLSESAVKMILRNETYYDPGYDPNDLAAAPERTRKLDAQTAAALRNRWMEEGRPGMKAFASTTGFKYSTVRPVLRNQTWHDPNFDPVE